MNNVEHTTDNTATLCQPWCTDHTADPDGDWCTGTAVDFHPKVVLELSTGTDDGSPGVFGVGAIGDNPLTIAGARELARILNQFADLSELAPASPRAGDTVKCDRSGCSLFNAGGSHTTRRDGSVAHHQGWQEHMERNADGNLVYCWNVGSYALDDEPWLVSLEVDGHTIQLDDEQAERMSAGLTSSVLHGLRSDMRSIAREAYDRGRQGEPL